MTDEFTTNLIEFLEDKAKEFNPNFSTSEGTAVRDLFVKPFSVIFQPIVDEILKVRQNLSLKNAEDLSEEDLDLLAANFFVTRRQGSKASGSVRVFFNEPVDEFLPTGTVFIAANGARFLSVADTTITSTGLRLNTYGDLFYWDVDVEAEAVGTAGNIPADLISDTESGSDKIVDVTNPAAFSGGTEAETNAQLLDRLAIAITFRNLLNDPGAKLILLENFPRLLDVLVVGFGDKHKITGENLGTGTGGISVFQLSETEDVIATSIDVYTAVADELVLTGPTTPGFKTLLDFPYDKDSLELRHPTILGTQLVADTDYVSGQNVSIADEQGTQAGAPPWSAGPMNPLNFYPVDVTPTIEMRAGPSFAAATATLTLGAYYADELVATGPVAPGVFQLDDYPVAAGSLEVRAGSITGTLLVDPADYTVNLSTGQITLTAAGAIVVNAAIPPDIHAKYASKDYYINHSTGVITLNPTGAATIQAQATPEAHVKYSATSSDPRAFALLPAGATALGADPLHAKYSAGPLDSSLVSGDFYGVVTFVTPPLAGTVVTADFEFYLMRRDRLSGNNLVLGDDTFGTVNYAHIGGKVDYYLKFLGLEENELRINGIKDTIFLFEQGSGDPPPAATEMYVSGLTLPIASIKNIELVDPGTNLPSGIFLAQVTGAPAPPYQYRLSIMPGKLNLNLSMRQKIKIEVSSDVLTRDIFFRYFSHQDFSAVQDFIDDPDNRIVTADLLARAPMPVFVDVAITYSRAADGPDSETVEQAVINYINGLKLGICLSAYDIGNVVAGIGVKFLQFPITMTGRRINLDFSTTTIVSQNKIEVPPNFQFLAENVTVTEVDLSSCVSI